VVYKSGEDRYPTGGTFDKNGNMWVLEADKNNQITVTKSSARPISPDK
jgi:hypothetical protein